LPRSRRDLRIRLAGITGRPKFPRIANVAASDDLVSLEFGRSHTSEMWETDIVEDP